MPFFSRRSFLKQKGNKSSLKSQWLKEVASIEFIVHEY